MVHAIAETRIIADRVTLATSTEIKISIWQGLKMSLKDYKLWIIILINITIFAAYGCSNFYPAIVRGFGYSRVITLVITFPPYFCAAMAAVSITCSSNRNDKTAAGISPSPSPTQWSATSSVWPRSTP